MTQTKGIYDGATGQETIVPVTKAELDEQYAALQAAADEAATNAALRAEQKAGLLERLGITAEEAELLLS
jgi:hypothetical protein